MDASTIGLIIVLAGVWFFYKKLQKQEKKVKNENAETVQDLLEYDELTDDGMVLKGNTFAVVLSVQPINIKMKSQSEKDGVWLNFRTFINTLPIHTTFLVQSQYLDMSDYIEAYEADNDVINLTPQLRESKKDVANHLRNISDRKTRDYHSYIILRFNPYRDGTEAGITTGSVKIDNLIKDIRGTKNRMSKEEAEELARSMLDEVADICYQSLGTIGITVSRLNKIGVFHFIHHTLNRDLAPYQRIHDIYEARGFSEFKQSLTPDLKEIEWKEEVI
ncbi:hypothetical protein [Calidifontibacillus erzurumensis]|uniref:hypothetical protein n=1 Tax=Calidifontibacillus erzurumensis TaxID=2741433 RepID=UPI0035B5516D